MSDRIDRIENRMATYDADLLLNALETIATSQAGKDGDYVAAVIDLGTGYIQGMFVVDVDEIGKPVTGNNVAITLQLAKDSAFASMVNGPIFEIGDVGATSLTWGGQVMINTNDQLEGWYKAPFHNMYGDSLFRYARVFAQVGGSIGTLRYLSYLSGMH